MVVSMAFIYTIVGYVMLKTLIFDVKIKDGDEILYDYSYIYYLNSKVVK